VTSVVIDASAGAEIVADTRRGRALARLVPADAEGWVPEHFYAEVLAVVRRRLLIEQTITEAQATAAVGRLRVWHLHKASVAPLIDAAWAYPCLSG
jgi:predicted nucleic acid-binding protein